MLELEQIRIDGGTQSRVELNQETVAEYAQAFTDGAAFPPVVVFFDGASYWLADGFHRYFGARDAGESAIDAEIRTGTQRDAVLYSWGANDKHGLPRSNADKRNIVTAILKDEQGRQWSDNKIAKDFGFSHPFVGNVRRSLETVSSEKSAERTYTTKHGTTAVMKTENIGKSPTRQQEGVRDTHCQPEPAPKAAPEAPPAPTNHDLEEAVSTINELAAENDQLRDRVAVAAMSGTDEERAMAAETIAELRDQIKTLEAELDAVRTSRDSFQRQNAELMKQVRLQQKQIKKLGG